MADAEDQILSLERSSRLTRGKRMTKLLDEEIEDDEIFWNQDALKEEENDDNYEEEQEKPDEFDSDFEEDEPDQDDEAENPAEERLPVKKRLIFPGKQVAKKKNKRKVLSKLEKSSKTEIFPGSNKPALAESQDATDELEGERTVRKSTRTSVIVRQAERDAIRAALQATLKPIKRKKEGEEKRMTQEEMLLEAAQTEIMNLRNLERVLAREEEVKKRAVVHKAECEGPQIRFTSRNGKSFIEFMKGSSFKSELRTSSAPYPQKSVCVVTGFPAKCFLFLDGLNALICLCFCDHLSNFVAMAANGNLDEEAYMTISMLGKYAEQHVGLQVTEVHLQLEAISLYLV
ncbi:SWR1 complex subunit 2 [Phalaenopsis equestris]|uniref:SWR1 complex subunit 2 n=1 Tax=Phalaenopsis equestris TaxID=78828 RepID=UPI0009E3DC1A|nr:SWR1 complex subunit 2 [Phalaenopsis equestris]